MLYEEAPVLAVSDIRDDFLRIEARVVSPQVILYDERASHEEAMTILNEYDRVLRRYVECIKRLESHGFSYTANHRIYHPQEFVKYMQRIVSIGQPRIPAFRLSDSFINLVEMAENNDPTLFACLLERANKIQVTAYTYLEDPKGSVDRAKIIMKGRLRVIRYLRDFYNEGGIDPFKPVEE